MPDTKLRNTKSQHETYSQADCEAARMAAQRLIDRAEAVLPCEAYPLIASACGCASASAIAAGLNGHVMCPLDVPWHCPLRDYASAIDVPPTCNTGASSGEFDPEGINATASNETE